MGKRRKSRTNNNLLKDALHNQHEGVKRENQFKHSNTSNKNIKKKCQKLQIEKLFGEPDAVATDDLSVSMNGLNISVIDDVDTDKIEVIDLLVDSVIVLDDSISTNPVDNNTKIASPMNSCIVIDETKKVESPMNTYIILDETFEEENKEIELTAKESTKSTSKPVPKLVCVSNKDQDVTSKENVKPPQSSTKINGKNKKRNKLNKDKYNNTGKILPFADATNTQRTKLLSNNSLFCEIIKTTRGFSGRNNDFNDMLEEYKYLKMVNSCTNPLSTSNRIRTNKKKEEELHDLSISYLENMKASLHKELQEETSQKKNMLRQSYVPEPDMNESMERYGNNYYAPKKAIKTNLRPIYIDGSNVAFRHAQGRYFSVTGLKICIDYFLKRGHEVHAFVPHFRKNKCSNPVLFEQLIKNGLIITTPSRYLNGRNLTPYDDRYIVKCAAVNKGIIVSCDNYRDLIKENPSLEPVIEQRLLMPMWVQDMLIFPDDPLGRNGPSLEEFLRF